MTHDTGDKGEDAIDPAKSSPPETAPRTGPHHGGFAAIIGAPNAGKSTLTNRLVGAKVSIVTRKVQTTRFPVRGVMMRGATQIVLVDTPGIFAPKRRLDRAMVRSAWAGAEDADAIVHMIDASAWASELSGRVSGAEGKSIADDKRVIADLKSSGRKAFLALNKIDLFKSDALLPITQTLFETGVYEEVFMISAERGHGVEGLAKALAARMPAGEWLYPEDQVADLPMRLLAAEVTREKLFLRLHDELPYQATVETENWEERKDGSVKIDQAILVGREAHKKMVLGRKGTTIHDIGKASRLDLETMLGRKVHLFLFVKVQPNWLEDSRLYGELGLDYNA
jgi:GTPase